MTTYWLSFADRDKPKGQQWLGVAVIEANDKISAVRAAHETGCNPGGEVAIVGLRKTAPWVASIPRNTLLTMENLDEHGVDYVAADFLRALRGVEDKQ